MSLFRFPTPRGTASRCRLTVADPAHSRARRAWSAGYLVAILRDDLPATIARHIESRIPESFR